MRALKIYGTLTHYHMGCEHRMRLDLRKVPDNREGFAATVFARLPMWYSRAS